MRIVLDTNVLISGIFFTGPPSKILAAWAAGGFDLIASVDVLAEYRRVGERLQQQFPTVDVQQVLDLVTRESRIVEAVWIPLSACIPARESCRNRVRENGNASVDRTRMTTGVLLSPKERSESSVRPGEQSCRTTGDPGATGLGP